MTLFTMLLVIIAERLFKLGEHWHLDHRLEVLFRRIKHFSMLRTLLMMAGVMVITFLLLRCMDSFSTCRCWWCGSCSACCALVRARCVCTITRT